MGSSPVARPEDLPEGFQLDPELPAGFTLDEPAAAKPGSVLPPVAEYLSRASGPFVKSLGSAALAAVNPMEYVRAGQGAVNAMLRPSEAANAAIRTVRGVGEAAQTPEGVGALAGGLTAGAIPLERIVSAAKAMRAIGITNEGRVSNIMKAVAAPDSAAANIERLAPEIDLPVAGRSSLERTLRDRMATTGAAVGSTESALTGTIPVADIAKGVDIPGVAIAREGPRGEYVATGSLDRAKKVAIERDLAELGTLGGYEETLPTGAVAKLTREAQNAAERGAVYKALPGQPVSAGSAASAEIASAANKAMKGLAETDPSAAAFMKAKHESEIAQTLGIPMEQERLRRINRPAFSRMAETLAGRAAVPLAGGKASLSPLGALAGLGIGGFLDSPVWNTLAAATKKRLLPMLESGDIAGFQDAAMKAIIVEHTRRKSAERALAAQGEGVTTP